MADDAHEVPARRGRDPDALGQPPARPPRRSAAAAAPGHDGARGARGPRRHLPDGAHPPGGERRARGRGPRGGARGLQALAPDAAVPRAAPGGRARYPGAHLLQVRGRLARRLAQAQHRGPAGLRERAGRHPQADHRDRRRAVGLVAGLRVPALRPGVRGLHGRLVLRPEALPALDDADVGRDGAPLAVARRPSPAAPTPARRPARWGSPSPRPSRSPPRTRTPTTRSGSVLNHVLLHQTVIGQESIAQMELAGDTARRRSSAASAAARTSPAWPTRGCGASCAPAPARASWPPSRRRARR